MFPPTIVGDFYRIPEKLPKSSADKLYRACETTDQTLKKIRTLQCKFTFPEILGPKMVMGAWDFLALSAGKPSMPKQFLVFFWGGEPFETLGLRN